MRGARGILPLLPLAALLGAGACSARAPVDGARALERVRHQVAAGPRLPGTPGHGAVREWLVAEITRLGGTVEQQSFTDSSLGRRLDLTNVIGHFGPARAPAGGSTRVIALLAHWDTRPWCDEDPDSARRGDPLPGANDAGSGVAVLLEVAEVMHRRPPPVGVDLVFLDGEDQGRASQPQEFSIGARAYVARLRERPPVSRPVAAFLFDMVGDRDLDIYPEVQSSQRAANLVALVIEGAKRTGGIHFHDTPRYSIVDDHVPLLDAGIPAVDIIDFDYPAWHTHLDLPDQVSAQSLAEVASVAVWLVYSSSLAQP
ncbi:MAG TPA: M28 family peptidase [Candidatus Eisenbacteria bacterium]